MISQYRELNLLMRGGWYQFGAVFNTKLHCVFCEKMRTHQTKTLHNIFMFAICIPFSCMTRTERKSSFFIQIVLLLQILDSINPVLLGCVFLVGGIFLFLWYFLHFVLYLKCLAFTAVEVEIGGFHLHLLVFPFIHQFNSRIGVLVHSSFAND